LLCRFAIQLKTAAGPQADLAFRFSSRWLKPQWPEVLGNTRVNNQWGKHVTFMEGSSPFIMGQNFQVMIMIEKDAFKVRNNLNACWLDRVCFLGLTADDVTIGIVCTEIK